MARMVDVEALTKAMGVHTYMQTEWTPATAWGVPIVDAEPVVRCKDCRFCGYDEMFDEMWCNGKRVSADWFCADGKRREDGKID